MRIHFLFVAKKNNYSTNLHLRHKRQYNLCANNNEEDARGTVNVFLLSRKKSFSIAIQDGFCKCLSDHRHNSSFPIPEIWTMRILKDFNLEPSMNSIGVQGLVMLCLSKTTTPRNKCLATLYRSSSGYLHHWGTQIISPKSLKQDFIWLLSHKYTYLCLTSFVDFLHKGRLFINKTPDYYIFLCTLMHFILKYGLKSKQF